MSNLRKIEEYVTELDKLKQSEWSIKERILSNVAKHYSALEKESPPEAMPREVAREIEQVTKILELNTTEIEMFDRSIHAARIINPCYLPSHSPTSRCAYTATRCSAWTWTAGVSSTAYACNTSVEANPKATANGYGAEGYSNAIVYAYAWFTVTPAYPAPAFVTINPRFDIHGFYRCTSGQHSAMVTLLILAEGYQYGHAWGSKTELVVAESGNTMGRYDQTKYLNFQMPVGADPFQVFVGAVLTATGRGEGTWAIGDFATGNGNKISIPYVNTWD